MKTSHFFIRTLREAPANTEIISHQLMLRAGMIRQLSTGIYTWLPLGLRVLRKIETIVREEMDKIGAQEILMPTIQPAKLWRESGRWEKYGPELLRIHDRYDREFCFGPTHEEIITDLVRREIKSYKQLPISFYQIHTKFRDEIRPRFGIMRAREFVMKDAYSFHLTEASLQKTYKQMHTTYSNIFKRLGLNFRAVIADSGNIGGSQSHEFHVLADSGEDQIVFSENSDYAANIEQAEITAPKMPRPKATKEMKTIETPSQHTITEISEFLGVPIAQCLKTLVVRTEDNGLSALILRGDHQLNLIKAQKIKGISSPLSLADSEEIRQKIGCHTGSIGPVNLSMPIYVDHSAGQVADFVCGANEDGKHLIGVNWERDLPLSDTFDLRQVCQGETAVDGSGPLKVTRGIEVGHIFQLGKKYTTKMKTACPDQHGKPITLTMGCYGIGVSRIVAAAIEQNHDKRGIIWPTTIAPFTVALIPINMHRSLPLRKAVLKLYDTLVTAGIDVILDDRHEHPGTMFADMELIGIPHRLVYSKRGLEEQMLEYRARQETENRHVPLADVVGFIQETLKPHPNEY